METRQFIYQNQQWESVPIVDENVQLVTVFFSIYDRKTTILSSLAKYYPNAEIVGCSSAGDIAAAQLYDDAIVITTFTFSKTCIRVFNRSISDSSLPNLCQKAVEMLKEPNLKWLMVLSDGHVLNGSEVAECLGAAFGNNVVITGGLAGDGERFSNTALWHMKPLAEGSIILCGFYSDSLNVSYASVGGWDSFGPSREITRAEGNRLYQLDNEPAITLYRNYLGPYANDLPASALRFPLQVRSSSSNQPVIRTILGIDYEDNSMVFAGDMPQGGQAQLMKANFDRLIDGANRAVTSALETPHNTTGVALLISCVGRKLVLGPRVEEELEVVFSQLTDGFQTMGFYSYGEIAPIQAGGRCLLHNQTMTVTLISE
ncbi:FIST N-terminal domain-containing protein [Pseudoalteromonas sp. MMG005]|uniref:FIST signal transduction protein n=1 Tax=Pseudoalteromonas sp. MMG005 TaxID=2822682 RepID=UPI001B3A7B70|nr:FIST N-terminal domain-containing protein [Pseudoalteromonas sp. MMG005]MBQ4845841.1 FIST C-terminal domain-containing protein [Pseudoalteromonas sp. MMG005]